MTYPFRALFKGRSQRLLDRGIAAEAAGEPAEAMRLYGEAAAADPRYAAARFNLGRLRLESGTVREAEADFRAALGIRPDFADAWMALAQVFEATGRRAEAVEALLEIPATDPLYPVSLRARIDLLQAMGRRAGAVPLLFEAVARDPGDAALRRTLALELHGATLGNAGERERGVLIRLCTDEGVSTSHLATAIAGVLRSVTTADLPRDALLLAALPRTSFADPALEERLTRIRRGLVLGEIQAPFEFTCALARHCFHSEYAYAESAEERAKVQSVREIGEATLRQPSPDTGSLEPLLALAALYDGLHTMEGSGRLPSMQWSAVFRPLVEEQVSNRARERELAAKIPALTPIAGDVTSAVRAQYEENPYPLWTSLQQVEVEPFEALSQRLRGRSPKRDHRPQVLIAGCGTGHHPAQVARSQPGSDIHAIDLSLASLGYAARMAERFSLPNIAFAQADLLKLGSDGRKFDVVESVGVLHHLRDPMEGWRVLVGLLEDDGLMRIALYSTRARACIRAAREVLLPLALPRTPDGIRRCRQVIMGLPAGHPARDVAGFRDFYSLSGCRDLLMHVQEHTFTPLQIAKCLDQLGLRLLKVECDALTQAHFDAMFPDPSTGTDFDAWDRMEQAHPDAFRGMIQFWCERAAG